MAHVEPSGQAPLVTYLIATHNRRDLLPAALRSALAQSYRNLQVIVMRDGGDPVRDVVSAFDDPRVTLIDRDENHGLAYTYNEAMQFAKGKYIAYLGDDDIHYPHHIATHVEALESRPEFQASYSQLYRTLAVKGDQPGERKVTSKSVIISRDYERTFELKYNLILGGACVHRRDLWKKTGPYNEHTMVLIDWDMMRRIAFFTDFLPLQEITGEFFAYIDNASSDRISDLGRKDEKKYFENWIAITNNRPPKPWPLVKDLSIVYMPDENSPHILGRLVAIMQQTFTPYLVVMPLSRKRFEALGLGAEMPNVTWVEVDEDATAAQRLDACLAHCQGDYIAAVPEKTMIFDQWVESGMYPLVQQDRRGFARLLYAEDDGWAVVARADDLRDARAAHGDADVLESLRRAGVSMRLRDNEETIFPFDIKLMESIKAVREGRYLDAAEGFGEMAQMGSELFCRLSQAWSLYHAEGRDDEALKVVTDLNRRRPWVDALHLEGKLWLRNNRPDKAVEAFDRARNIYRITA